MFSKRLVLTALAAVLVTGSITGAASPQEAPPSCGSHVTVKRSGSTVRVVGVDLTAFMPYNSYGLSYTYEANGTAHGGYNVSANNGMSYSFTAGKSTAQTFHVAIFNTSESLEYCSGNYTA